MKKSVFITIEGGEGVGKTTQVNLLKEHLPALFPHREFVFTKEPGGTTFADHIRGLILSDEAKEANGKTMFGLFIASRFDHIERVVSPALKAGKVVVCDRYIAATYAYQIRAQGSKELLPMYREHLKLLKNATPDFTVVLDLDPTIALARVAKRKGQEFTHFDARDISFHKRLRVGYREYAKKFARRTCVFVNANQPVEEVRRDITSALDRVIAGVTGKR